MLHERAPTDGTYNRTLRTPRILRRIIASTHRIQNKQLTMSVRLTW